MHLFLDLDSTLIDNYFNEKNEVIIKERPYIKPFFNYIFKKFETISIWTNANDVWMYKVYQDVLLKYIPYNKNFTYILTNNCDDRTPKIKDFNYLFKKHPNMFNKYNTFILDDNPYTYQNNKENAIPIKPYYYVPTKPDNDNELLRVMFMMDKYL
jgi:TFIIF-interacting CTD phosphatase-like protein